MTEKFETRTIEESLGVLIDYRGKTPPKTECGVRLVTAKVIKDGYVQDDKKEFIAADFYDEWMRRGLPKRWDIVITTEAPLGEVAQLRSTEKVALAQRVILLRTNPDVYDQSFFFQALKGDYVQGGLKARGTGTTVLGIKQSELRKVKVPWFPLPTQRKIASILSAYDDLIENNTRRIAILEELAQAIYREWFVNFRFPGHENVKLVQSTLGMIPEGWKVVALENLTNTNRKITYGVVKPGEHDPNGVLFVRGGDILGGQVDENALRTISSKLSVQYKRTLLKGGELIVSLVGNPGEVAIVPSSLAGANIARQVGLVVLEEPLTTAYIKRYLMSSLGKDELFAHTTGSVQKVINLANLKVLRVISPPSNILKRTMPVFLDEEAQVQNLRKKNENLRATRDLLLPKLISGQLDVEDIDIDLGTTAEALEEATAS